MAKQLLLFQVQHNKVRQNLLLWLLDMHNVATCTQHTFWFLFAKMKSAFSALMLLWGGREGIWPVKNWVVQCWHGYLTGARCRLAYGSADATATHCLLLQ